MNEPVSNPNDYKVVEFTNKADFTFTPEMGCMFNGNPIFGITGAPGINAGESMKLPYHVAQRLAVNLAKFVMMRGSGDKPQLDAAGQPITKAIWDTVKLEEVKNSYLTDLYMQEKPVAQTETQRLEQMVKDLNKVVEGLVNKPAVEQPVTETVPATPSSSEVTTPPNEVVAEGSKGYSDKQEVIAELEKRGIKHDKRKSKEDLEKLLNA